MSDAGAITWSPGRPLSWADFRADPNPAAFEDAHCAITYRPTWVVDSRQDERGTVFFLIRNLLLTTEFVPHLSWARPARTPVMLHHEQGHFDLGEIVMREGLAAIQSALYGRMFPTRGKNEDQRRQFAKEDSAMLIDSEVRALLGRLGERRARYDAETEYGANAQQAGYDEIFAGLRP